MYRLLLSASRTLPGGITDQRNEEYNRQDVSGSPVYSRDCHKRDQTVTTEPNEWVLLQIEYIAVG